MTFTTHSLSLPNHYVVIDLDGRPTLLDSGCPLTMSPDGSLRLLERRFDVQCDLGFLPDHAPGLRGLFEVLLGTDVLRHYSFTIYWDDRKVVISDEAPAVDGVRVPFELIGGVPLVHLEWGGVLRPVIFDTGAPLSYARPELLTDSRVVEQASDEHPIIGEWETPVHVVRVTLGDRAIPVPTGVLPDHPMSRESFHFADAVIGTAMFRAFDPVCFNFPDGKVVFVPRTALATACDCDPRDPPLFRDVRCPWLLHLDLGLSCFVLALEHPSAIESADDVPESEDVAYDVSSSTHEPVPSQASAVKTVD